jgi:hypothetical protein
VVVRCTRKMLELLGRRSVTLSELPPSDDDWYLNLVWIERQKCLPLTHTGTLFSVLRVGVRVADLRPLGDYLVGAIQRSSSTGRAFQPTRSPGSSLTAFSSRRPRAAALSAS